MRAPQGGTAGGREGARIVGGYVELSCAALCVSSREDTDRTSQIFASWSLKDPKDFCSLVCSCRHSDAKEKRWMHRLNTAIVTAFCGC
eukprot:SAG11_NODE_492_length_8971_cov_3.819206_3_plen_88_part_00